MKIQILIFSIALILLFTAGIRAQNCQANRDLPNFGCINANVYRGAQPTDEGIKELARRGVKTIINLRDADDNSRLEETKARNAGIRFVSVSLSNWFAPKNAKMAEIMTLLDDAENQPVFVHCQRGADRTGTVIAAYRISHDGWTAKQARAEAHSFKFGWWQFWMNDYIGDYYKNFQKRKTPLLKSTDKTVVSH